MCLGIKEWIAPEGKSFSPAGFVASKSLLKRYGLQRGFSRLCPVVVAAGNCWCNKDNPGRTVE